MPSVEPLPAGSVLLQHNWVESFHRNQVESDESHQPIVEEYPCTNPINPHMRQESMRIQSFYSQSWNQDFLQASPEELAKAGLFFTGRSDRVKCWYCNGGLQNWDYTDSPIQEHAKWYPQCEFILREKGADFVQAIFDQNPGLKRPRIRNGSLKFRPNHQKDSTVPDDVTVMAVMETPAPSNPVESTNDDVVMTPVTESPADKLSRLVDSTMEDSDAVVQSVAAMGFDQKLIRNTLTKLLADDSGYRIESRFQLVEAVLEFEST